MKSEQQLTVEFGDGSRVDEYRVRERHVEFRARCPDGSTLPDRGRDWRRLTAEDISMHLALRTVVGDWLMLRLFTTTHKHASLATPSHTILCIDDQEYGLSLCCAFLERQGHTVLTATSASQALELIEHDVVDAVVLSYRMEGLDGEAVASILKRRRPELPIVLVSGYAAELCERTRRLVDAVVAKGQQPRLLLSAIHRVLTRSSRRPKMPWESWSLR